MSNSLRNTETSMIAAVSRPLLALLLALLVGGCASTGPTIPPELLAQLATKHTEIILREGDVIKLAFPGAPNLDDTQQIRRDGKVALKQAGDLVATGKTLAELEKEILKVYADQLVVKQVSVTLGSSAYPVFIMGAVARGGKIMADRPLTLLEGIMEAGGFDFARANTKQVVVLREIGGQMKNFKVNMKDVLKGKPIQTFYLQPSDIVYVPEKFSWF